MPRLSDAQKKRAVARVRGDELVPVAELAAVLGCPAKTAERWVVTGHEGIHLDGLHRPGKGWLSSMNAVRRFWRLHYEQDAVAADLEEDRRRAGTVPADVSAGLRGAS